MVIGGIPMYLNAIEAGKSAAQNIDKICFSEDGALTNEFDNLYAALFNAADKHVQVIKALARKNKGLTRNEVLDAGKLMTGGAISTILNELTESGFIEKIHPFKNEEKNALYRLSDQLSLFYFRFMQNKKVFGKGQWVSMSNTQAYTSWCGYAFENICFTHIQQIRKALQIAGMQYSASSWHKSGNGIQEGAQIDLLIDRADQSINVCEMEFSFSEFTITKKYAAELKRKLAVFKNSTKTRKALFLTMVTTYGATTNIHSTGLVQNQVTMEAFFKMG